jgi:uncharacterized protein (DUF58 family)
MRAAFPPVWLGPGGYALLVVLTIAAAALSSRIGWFAAVVLSAMTFVTVVAIEVRRDRDALALRREVPARLVLGRASVVRIIAANRVARPMVLGATLAIACLPHERGETAFTATYAWFEVGLRIVRHRRRIDDPVTRRVVPDVPAFDAADDLVLRARLTREGSRRLVRAGSGSEFASFRAYQPGDAFRDVDWKATARRGRMMVAEHELERSQQIGLVIDAGRLMAARVDGRRKLDIAISAALGIATVAQRAGDRVGAHAFAGTTLARVAPLAGPPGTVAILAALGAVEPRADEPDYERAALEIGRTYRKRSLLIVFTDLFDPVASAALVGVLGVLARRHVVVLAMINDGVLAAALADASPGATTRRAVAGRLANERAGAVAALRARGMIVVDVPATELRPRVLDAYVTIKERGTL